uniref:TreY n=1 Tax=Metallosphaera hakonensis TaxID=79601 RepID=Q6SZP7_9CREN|nr:TreY [Metallosphaera hakonensis]
MLVATYRLQLNKGFPFSAVTQLLDYFQELGVSHLYLSPVLKARPSSSHGYDVVDPPAINDELGGMDDYLDLLRQAKERSLGVIQDIVPNHMAVHQDNWRLMDLLRKWRESRYYEYFDHYRGDKLILPFLEADLETVLREGKIRVEGDWIRYGDLKFPINEEGRRYLETLDRLGAEELRKLLSLQHYELRYWKESPNYRRFFAVNDLIAVKVELDHVFQESHSLILGLPVDGLRIDHVDGLRDPGKYLTSLREKVGNKVIYVEKILQLHEKLREDWPVEGTTGYDFLNYVNLLLVTEPEKMVKIYEDFVERKVNVKELIRESKKLVAETLFKGDLEMLSMELQVDFNYLVEFLSCLRIYRSYVGNERELEECDRGNKIPRDKIARLQQYMPAIFAKGYEDTALFRYNALISVNEVGSDLATMSISMEEFHRFNVERRGTGSINATSTHDTKFSEDVRARISVISEIPDTWRERVWYWHDLLKPRVDRNDEYRLYQTLVGSYQDSPDYGERLKNHMIKVLREAKTHTTWENPNTEYEQEMISLVEEVLHNRSFVEDFLEFESTVVRLGYKKSLVTLALKMLSPGVPDIYQGTEVWRFLLTDPDNRIPVDFERLKTVMRNLPREMELDPSDERVKMWFTRGTVETKEEGIRGSTSPIEHGFRRGNVILLFSPKVTKVQEGEVELGEDYVNLVNGERERKVNLRELERYGILVLMKG